MSRFGWPLIFVVCSGKTFLTHIKHHSVFAEGNYLSWANKDSDNTKAKTRAALISLDYPVKPPEKVSMMTFGGHSD